MKLKINWKITILSIALFLGGYLGTISYYSYYGDNIVQRVDKIESEIKILASVGLMTITEILESKKEKSLYPDTDFDFTNLNLDKTIKFDPNSILKELYLKENKNFIIPFPEN